MKSGESIAPIAGHVVGENEDDLGVGYIEMLHGAPYRGVGICTSIVRTELNSIKGRRLSYIMRPLSGSDYWLSPSLHCDVG